MCRPVAHDELTQYQEQVKPYMVLRVKAQMDEKAGSGIINARLVEIVSTNENDAELIEWVRRLQEPITLLWQSQEEWNERVCQLAVEKLLPLKNEGWLDQDEAEVTSEQFRNRMKVESITLYPDASFEFLHNDGDLFFGHSILVSGSIPDGPTDADIPG